MKKRMLLVFSLGMFLLFTFSVSNALAVDPIKIGCHAELTGKYSVYGKGMLNAVRHEVAMKNSAGGIKSLGGAKIELVVMDNATDPKTSVANHERLGADKDILGVVGPCGTPLTQPAEPVAGKYGLPTVYAITTLDRIFEHDNKYVFTVSVLASRIGGTYAQFMINMNKKYGVPLNRISLAYPDNDYGITVAEGFKAELKKNGLDKNIVLTLPFDWKAKDLNPIVLKIKAAKPDFHMQVAYFADGKLYHDACYHLDFHPYAVGGASGFNHPKLWKVLGKDIAAATIGNKKTFAYDIAALDLPNASRDAWVKGFSAKNPKIPIEMNLFMGAMAGRFLIEAIEKAGKRDRKAIAEALHGLNLAKDDPREFIGAFETPGPVWQPNGKPNSWGYIAQWEQTGEKWKKRTLFHPLKGMMVAPRAFR